MHLVVFIGKVSKCTLTPKMYIYKGAPKLDCHFSKKFRASCRVNNFEEMIWTFQVMLGKHFQDTQLGKKL